MNKVVVLFQVDRKQQIVIIAVAAVIIFTAGYRVSRWQGEQYREPGKTESVVQTGAGEGGREIVVHVSGAVEKPGVYKFTREMRVMDALDKAVPLAGADVQGLNLAAPLKDGQKIVVPLKQQLYQSGGSAPQASGTPPLQQGGAAPQTGPAISPGGPVSPPQAAGSKTPARVNINRAGSSELESLPGLGPGLSQRIISYRESKGLFTSEEDIKSVPGIGEKLYEQLKDHITVK
ncbi:MAG: helix-hairpin-helix domain-containing protein [Desulfocucumaceae bacterium]